MNLPSTCIELCNEILLNLLESVIALANTYYVTQQTEIE